MSVAYRLAWVGLLLGGCGGGSSASPITPIATAPTPAPTPTATATPQVTGVATTGCRATSARYPWGQATVRRWTPVAAQPASRPSDAPGTASGKGFDARLIEAYGEDTRFSSRTAEFEFADGCRRRYRTASLSAADVTVIEAAIARHPLAVDTASYATEFQAGRASQAALNAGTLGRVETQHFVLWYGVKTEGASYRWARDNGIAWPTFLRDAGAWMETQWLWNRDILDAPMPYRAGQDRKRINIYICGTGLPFLDHGDLSDCGASAADAAWVSAPNLRAGSTTLIHEFGHVIQFYTGGFRDKGDAGPIWETGAEWNSYALSPSYAGFLPIYLNNLENGPLWSHARYGAHPFFTFLYQHDRTRPFFWRAWTDNLRTGSGATTEDYLQAFVRLGRAAGIYPNGFASFADDIGWYGARLAAMDFIDQRALLDATTASSTQTWASHLYAPLVSGAAAGDYVSSPARPLIEFGTHLIPLTATGATVTVTLTGATTANQAAWRFVLVAVRNGTDATYSMLGAASGTGSGTIARTVPADAKLYLAVTATPGVYETLGWQGNGPVTGTRFPYGVRMTGATPSTADPVPCASNVAQGTWTLNYNTNGNREDGKPC